MRVPRGLARAARARRRAGRQAGGRLRDALRAPALRAHRGAAARGSHVMIGRAGRRETPRKRVSGRALGQASFWLADGSDVCANAPRPAAAPRCSDQVANDGELRCVSLSAASNVYVAEREPRTSAAAKDAGATYFNVHCQVRAAPFCACAGTANATLIRRAGSLACSIGFCLGPCEWANCSIDPMPSKASCARPEISLC